MILLLPFLVLDESGVFMSIGVHLKSRQKVLISDRGADTWNIQMYIVSSVLTALLLSAICELY